MLFRKYQPFVFRQVFFRVRETDVAHEIVQETFVRVWEHRTALKPHLPFLALTLRISGNIIRDNARHRSTRERLEQEIPPDAPSEGDNPADILELRILEGHIADIVSTRLGDRCRAVFLLSKYEGKSQQEISRLLGISVKTVENHITHALSTIRTALERRGVMARRNNITQR
jgi:RNA polymerase sigma-70 factor (ECF subfamily)